jgi:hypothetical protein
VGAALLGVVPGCRLLTVLSSLGKRSEVQQDLTLHRMRSREMRCISHTLSEGEEPLSQLVRRP